MLQGPAVMGRTVRGSITPGLDRLEVLRREGQALFQGARWRDASGWVYPQVLRTSFDPRHHRGFWLPGHGLLLPFPMIADIVASPLAAAMLTLAQNIEGPAVFHVDEFPDGVVALTVGENSDNQGMLERTMRAASRLDDVELLPDCYVNVLPRSEFPADRRGFPLVGLHIVARPVRVLERVAITAGDARALARYLGRKLPSLEDREIAQANPFTRSFSAGGHLQFDPISGAQLSYHRCPNDEDRRVALALSSVRATAWLQRRQIIEREAMQVLPAPSAPLVSGGYGEKRPVAGTSIFGRVLSFIDQNCNRPLSVGEIAGMAQMSGSRLNAVFRETLGCTPLRYVSERRLDLAEQLLSSTGISVAEVSERCGFAEQTSLTRSLRRSRGITPSSLRKAAQVSDRNNQ